MRVNNVLGIIFANMNDSALPELTEKRAFGSVPFAGRYRLIDFTLSNMVNSGIGKVGVITKSNYQSLMDHLGSGKPWDLSRKKGGLYLLPPFYNIETGGVYKNRIHALYNNIQFMERSVEEYLVLSDCVSVANFDFSDFLQSHTRQGADITLAYCHGTAPKFNRTLLFDIDDDGRIHHMTRGYQEDIQNYSANMIIIRKSLLIDLVTSGYKKNASDLISDILEDELKNLKIYGYKIPTCNNTIYSLASYYDVSMRLLDKKVNQDLFVKERPIYTKVRDDMPAKYGLSSAVKNSLIADGCIIEGEVENSILFRGVVVKKGAVIKNSILMQSAVIEENADLNHVILDKNVTVSEGKKLEGVPTYPVYVNKRALV